MKIKSEWNKEFELSDIDLEELARLIKEGFTSGRLDSGNKCIYWELNINSWIED